VKKLLLCSFLAGDELDVVQQQQLQIPKALPEGGHFLIANRVDEFVGELFGGDVECFATNTVFKSVVADRIQKVCLPQTDPPKQKQGVVI